MYTTREEVLVFRKHSTMLCEFVPSKHTQKHTPAHSHTHANTPLDLLQWGAEGGKDACMRRGSWCRGRPQASIRGPAPPHVGPFRGAGAQAKHDMCT